MKKPILPRLTTLPCTTQDGTLASTLRYTAPSRKTHSGRERLGSVVKWLLAPKVQDNRVLLSRSTIMQDSEVWIRNSGFKIQGSAIGVGARFLGKRPSDRGFSQGSGNCDHGGCLVSGERIGFGIQGRAIRFLGKGGSDSECMGVRKWFSLNPKS